MVGTHEVEGALVDPGDGVKDRVDLRTMPRNPKGLCSSSKDVNSTPNRFYGSVPETYIYIYFATKGKGTRKGKR